MVGLIEVYWPVQGRAARCVCVRVWVCLMEEFPNLVPRMHCFEGPCASAKINGEKSSVTDLSPYMHPLTMTEHNFILPSNSELLPFITFLLPSFA